MFLTSNSFEDGASIPPKFTCDGGDINPELEIHNVPEDAKSLVLIVDDPDVPEGTFVHWLIWNIDPRTTLIKQESKPPGAVQGANSGGTNVYIGPCPPSGTHHYRFKLFALDTLLRLPETAYVSEVEEVMKSHIMEQCALVGLYKRQS